MDRRLLGLGGVAGRADCGIAAPAALSDGVPAAWPDEDSSEIWAAEGDPAVPAEEANDSAALSSAAPHDAWSASQR